VARAVLRSVLGEVCGLAPDEVVLGTEEGGRPVIVPCDGRRPPDFNVSHSGRWALIAVAPPGLRVGVDLEWEGREVDCLAMARTMFQPAETRRLEVLDGVQRRREFFRLWTAKEAYVKADGAGVAGLRAVLVDGALARSSAPSAGFPAALPVSWFAAAPGYPAALVVSDGAAAPGYPAGLVVSDGAAGPGYPAGLVVSDGAAGPGYPAGLVVSDGAAGPGYPAGLVVSDGAAAPGYPAGLVVSDGAAAPGYPAALVVSGGTAGSGPPELSDRFLES
jgi:4'-phosphopantetheinyl transferase